MTPIGRFIDKIWWDPREDPHYYTICYYDRIEQSIRRIPLSSVLRKEGNQLVVQAEGCTFILPLHRIRTVEKGDLPVWER